MYFKTSMIHEEKCQIPLPIYLRNSFFNDKHKKYGFRYASAEEAYRLGYKEDSEHPNHQALAK